MRGSCWEHVGNEDMIGWGPEIAGWWDQVGAGFLALEGGYWARALSIAWGIENKGEGGAGSV